MHSDTSDESCQAVNHASDNPSDLTLADPRNWNFDAVPESQIEPCCVYEYARESPSIRDAVSLANEAKDREGIPMPETPERETFRTLHQHALNLLHLTGFELKFWLYLPFPEPWLSVDHDTRAQWAGVKQRDLSARPPPPFRLLGDIGHTKLLYDLACEAQHQRDAAWNEVMRCHAACEVYPDHPKLLYETQNPPPVSLRSPSFLTFVAQINWRDWTKPEIKQAICNWIDGNDAANNAEPSERGHKPLDWKRKLRDLGVMRLMHEFELGNMKRRHPHAWKLYHDQAGWTDRYWYLARNRSLQHFHTLLHSHPLLPANLKAELPISWETKAIRRKQRH